jgi:ketosteroid isomerase-like protein
MEVNMSKLVSKIAMAAMGSVFAVAAALSSSPASAQSVSLAYVLQNDPAIPDITTRQQRDDVMKLFTAHLGLWMTRDPNGYPYERLVTEDVVFEYPYAATETGRRIEGRAAVADALRKLPRGASDWQVDEVKLFQTAYPNVFFVSYDLSAPEHAYTQHFLARVTVRNGQIANYLELWDRDVVGAVSAANSHN